MALFDKFKQPPMMSYYFKLMTEEALLCYQYDDAIGITWIEKQIFLTITRWKELQRRDGK